MIKHVFKSFRSFARALYASTALQCAKTLTRKSADAWLFEDEQTTHNMSVLPSYPEREKICQSEGHQLEELSATLAHLVDDIEWLRSITLSAQKLAACAADTRNTHSSIYSGVTLGGAVSKRLSDPVVTEVLFDQSFSQELDGDLFELSDSGDTVQMLPAFQVSRDNRPVHADLYYSSRSGG